MPFMNGSIRVQENSEPAGYEVSVGPGEAIWRSMETAPAYTARRDPVR